MTAKSAPASASDVPPLSSYGDQRARCDAAPAAAAALAPAAAASSCAPTMLAYPADAVSAPAALGSSPADSDVVPSEPHTYATLERGREGGHGGRVSARTAGSSEHLRARYHVPAVTTAVRRQPKHSR